MRLTLANLAAVEICIECWCLKLRAFFRRPDNGKPGELSPAGKLVSASAAACIICGGPWTPAAVAQAPAAYSVIHRADVVIRSWPPGLPAYPDNELPHNEPPEPNFDGPAPEQSSTAPTFGLATPPLIPPPDPVQPALPPPSGPAVGPLPLKPVLALPTMSGMPRHALLPGPHGAPTYQMGDSPKPGPFGAASGPGLTAA